MNEYEAIINRMPALKLFGRRWLAASDDLTFPCIFEFLWRIVFLGFSSIALRNYWIFFESQVVIDDETHEVATNNETSCHEQDVIFIKIYLIGVNAIVALNLPLLALLIYNSGRGSIADTNARRLINPLLYLKIFLILPEVAANVMATLWTYTGFVQCTNLNDSFANTTVEYCTIFYWIIFCVVILSIMLAYDPLGAKSFKKIRDDNGNFDSNEYHDIMHRKITKLWLRRFKLAFCCVSNGEFGDEAFTQSAELFSHLFRGTDLVPTDLLAGSILLRIRQKKEQRELLRVQMLNDTAPKYSSDLTRIFSTQPQWMTLRNAQHFLRFAVSSYGWPMVCAIAPCRGWFGMLKKVTCCMCFRKRRTHVVEDNCCQCNVAGARFASRIHNDDVIYASFKNQVFEVPFCILADHSTKSVVLTIRGSWSLSDIFTDLAAAPRPFHAPGMPEDTVAHHGMAICCERIIARLMEDNLLERALAQYPDYDDFVITGHSLGAGLAVLIGAKLRSIYPYLKVYGFATPSGLLSREAAKLTEQFAFTMTVGDDFVARMSLEGVESLKTGILETLQSCKLPKYKIIMKGIIYSFLGIPTKDLEKPWYDVNEIAQISSHSSTLLDSQVVATISHHCFGGNPTLQAPRRKLYIAGRILHIVRKKKSEIEKGSISLSPYEMRWAMPEDFNDMKVMPRMMLDHWPHNIMKVLTKILKERNSDSQLSVDKI